MPLPFFFTETTAAVGETLTLNEETSKHVISVLRIKKGEQIHLTNGKGSFLTAEIINDHKKKCDVIIKNGEIKQQLQQKATIAISLLKNANRFEWFLEKATEVGVTAIIPLLCERTERQHFRDERMEGLLISAMLQSRQCWLPQLFKPMRFDEYIHKEYPENDLFIAHCVEDEKEPLHLRIQKKSSSNICIGPEGDFSLSEINAAIGKGFKPVSLGHTRLRSETAGIVAAVYLTQLL